MGYLEGGAWIPRPQERVVKQLGEAPLLGQGTCSVRVPGGPAEAAAAAQTLGRSCRPVGGWWGLPSQRDRACTGARRRVVCPQKQG